MKLIKHKNDKKITNATKAVNDNEATYNENKEILAKANLILRQYHKIEVNSKKQVKKIKKTSAIAITDIDDLFTLLSRTSEEFEQLMWQRAKNSVSSKTFKNSMLVISEIESAKANAEIAIKELKNAYEEVMRQNQYAEM